MASSQKETWHHKHVESLTKGQRIADGLAHRLGSWTFIIIQTFFVIVWMVFNIIGYIQHWDPYPFILLNLLFSTQAAYAAPVIMMAQNRQNERDRHQAQEDFETNLQAKEEIEQLQKELARIELLKLDKIIVLLEKISREKEK